MGRRRKKQVPRCARNDNSRAFGRAVRPLVGLGMAGRGEVGVMRILRERERWWRVVRVWGRARRGSRGCL